MIYYVGNKLAKHGRTPTVIDTLSPLLAKKYKVLAKSDKLNKVQRLLDMLLGLLLRRNAIQVVLIDTYSTSNFLYAKLVGQLSRRLGIRYIPILHGGNLPMKIKEAKPDEMAFFTGASALVAPSGYLYNQLFPLVGDKLVYIPNNIELANYPFKERDFIKPRLLWVRSFHEIYNPGMAIRVLKILKQSYKDACLLMIGPEKDGSMQKAKDLANELGLGDDVIFTGKLSTVEWHARSVDYDIFLNTTNVDNTPVSVIEAMALGLPVVSTNAGGLPYLIENGKTGLLVEKKDEQAMVQAINSYLTDPAKALEISKQARAYVNSFDWEQIKSSWFALIDKTAGK